MTLPSTASSVKSKRYDALYLVLYRNVPGRDCGAHRFDFKTRACWKEMNTIAVKITQSLPANFAVPIFTLLLRARLPPSPVALIDWFKLHCLELYTW